MVDGKRKREVRATLDLAITAAEAWRETRDKEGLDALGLPSAVRGDAARAWRLLEPHNVSLTAAADYYLEKVVAYKTAPTVREVVAALLRDKVAEKMRPSSMTALRLTLGRFVAAFGERQLHTVSLRELKAYLHRPEHSPRTRINTIVAVGGLYNYALQEEHVAENLCRRIKRPSPEESEPGILTVDQCAALLRVAPRFKLLPYAVLGLFFGLRPAELTRMRWEAINEASGIVTVGPEVAKMRRRRTFEAADFSDAARAFLARHKGRRVGRIVSPSNFRKRFDAWRKAAGVTDWPHDAMRHTFGTMHYHAHGDDTRTARVLGHIGTALLHDHYRAMSSKADGLAFFALRPTP
jgi:integrase